MTGKTWPIFFVFLFSTVECFANRYESIPDDIASSTAGPKIDACRIVTIEDRRKSKEVYLNGVIFYQRGQYEDARKAWNLSRELDPSNSDRMFGPDWSKCKKEDIAKTKSYSAQDYFEQGYYAFARDEWADALAYDSSNKDAQAGLEFVTRLCGKGLPPNERWKSPKPSAEAKQASRRHYISGMDYFRSEDYLSARKQLAIALCLDGRNEEIMDLIKRVNKASGTWTLQATVLDAEKHK